MPWLNVLGMFHSWVQPGWAGAQQAAEGFASLISPSCASCATPLPGRTHLSCGQQKGAFLLHNPPAASASPGLLPQHSPSLNLVLCFWLRSFEMFSVFLASTDPSGIFVWCTLFYWFKCNNTSKVQSIFNYKNNKKKKAEHSIVLPLVVGERVDFSSLNLIEFNHHCCGVFLQFLWGHGFMGREKRDGRRTVAVFGCVSVLSLTGGLNKMFSEVIFATFHFGCVSALLLHENRN